MADWTSLRKRTSGKWQIPLLLVSSVLLGGALLRYRQAAQELTPTEALELLTSLQGQQAHEQVLDVAQETLQKEGLPDGVNATLHLHLARASSALAIERKVMSEKVGDGIVEAYGVASAAHLPFTAEDFANLGRAHEWRRRFDDAVKYFEKAISLGAADRTEMQRHVLLLRKEELAASPAEYSAALDRFLMGLDPSELDIRLWAVEQKLETLAREDQWEEANGLLMRELPTFAESKLVEGFEYLQALVLYKTGQFDDAERLLRAIRNRVQTTDEVHARTGWLLGRTILNDGGPQRPEEAISFFNDVIEYHAKSAYAVASRIGLAEAYAYLDRHDDAVSSYRIALEDLEKARKADLADATVVRASLSIMAETMRLKGDLKSALDYAELMAGLIDRRNTEQATAQLRQLLDLQKARGEELAAQESTMESPVRSEVEAIAVAPSEGSRKLFAAASETAHSLARMTTLAQTQSANHAWDAAELAARAGRWNRAIELYQGFALEHPRHPMVPRSLLRQGQLNQGRGDLTAAANAFQEVFRRYPRTLEGSRALIPLAECYLSMGPGHEELVEKSLRLILDDSEVFTPQAPEFADALFLLGEVQNRRGVFEEAVSTLEEVVQRYPDDPRLPRALFLLADSYRQSALAIQTDLTEVKIEGDREDMRKQMEARLRRARELYQSLITTFEARGADRLNALERVYLRLASLYVADCHFEMQDYATALKLYESAAAAYGDTVSALAAYVQIINCHTFLGEKAEARAALARALILTDVMPDAALARNVSPEGRDDWKRYFEWLGKSELF